MDQGRGDGVDGKLAGFEVKYTFGVDPLQQYLVSRLAHARIIDRLGHHTEGSGRQEEDRDGALRCASI